MILSSYKRIASVAVILLGTVIACGIPTNIPQLPSVQETVAALQQPPSPTSPSPSAITAGLVRTNTHNPPDGQAQILLSDVVVAPDGMTLASAGGTDHLIKIWNVLSGEEMHTLTGHTDAVTSVAFSPDGKILASGSWDSTVRLWDTATGQELHTLTGHVGSVSGVAFSPDGRILVSAAEDQTVRLWDVANGTQTQSGTASENLLCVAFSPDGQTIAAGTGPGNVILWDVATMQERANMAGQGYRVLSVAFSPDGKRLASVADATLTIWDVAAGAEVQRIPMEQSGETQSVAFSPDGKTIAVGVGNVFALLDSATGKTQAVLSDPNPYGDSVGISFFPSPINMVAGVIGDKIYLWSLQQ